MFIVKMILTQWCNYYETREKLFLGTKLQGSTECQCKSSYLKIDSKQFNLQIHKFYLFVILWAISSLRSRKETLSINFFHKILEPSSCFHYLIPNKRCNSQLKKTNEGCIHHRSHVLKSSNRRFLCTHCTITCRFYLLSVFDAFINCVILFYTSM